MKSKSKNQKKDLLADPPSPVAKPFSSRHGWLLAFLAVVVFLGTWGIFELVVWSKLPQQLIGTWVVVEGPSEYKDAIFDFYRNGTMEGKVNMMGDTGIIKASVRVEGNKIYSTSRHPQTGETKTQVQIIRTLTATELVVEDEQGKILKMKRAEQ